MKRNSLKIIKAATAAILTLSFLFLTAGSSSANIENLVDGDHRAGVYYTMVDENGQVIMRTARVIVVGDEYISSDNNYYRVTSVKGQTAQAELLEKRTLAAPPQPGLWERISSRFRSAVPVQQKGEQKSKKIAIYSSHGAESYIKGDGTESKDPGGGILDVRMLCKRFGRERHYSDSFQRTTYTHDAGAYQRSRRTVEEAMKEQPDALIDAP